MAILRSGKKQVIRQPILWLLLPLVLTSYALLRSSLHEIRQHHQMSVDCPEPKKDPTTHRPQIVWLTSFPNSGTSYTMTMVERATNVSTATNYGMEVTLDPTDDAEPVYPDHPEGPFWDGLSGRVGTARYLPEHYVMTKTHCGGRCVKCPASEYRSNATDFLQACQKTSGFFAGERFESHATAPVAKVIHLLRNPLTNVIARFHLEHKHLNDATWPRDANGFRAWCAMLDEQYSGEDSMFFTREQLELAAEVPCHAEFYKYVQWHNLLLEIAEMNQWPVLTVYYEEYSYGLVTTAARIFEFLEQTPVDGNLRPFRDLPPYLDHMRPKERKALRKWVREVASPATWKLLQRYFEDSASSK